MDFGQQRLQQQEAAKQMMYQNSGYLMTRAMKEKKDRSRSTKRLSALIVLPLLVFRIFVQSR